MDQHYTDYSIMPFGKYVGKPLINIPAQYFIWLYNKGCEHPGIKKYINDNLDILNKEASKSTRH